MPANSAHPQYTVNLCRWNRARDVLGGNDSVKDGGAKYLPKLSKQSDAEYENYKMRADFFNATARTSEAFSGMIFRRDPVVKVPKGNAQMESLIEDCTLGGETFYGYSKKVTDEVLGIGRCGSMVEWSKEENRPFFVFYQADQIINWRTIRYRGRMMLSLVVLKEWVDGVDETAAMVQRAEETPVNVTSYEGGRAVAPGGNYPLVAGEKAKPDPGDYFVLRLNEQLRVLRLELPMDRVNGEPKYVVEIWIPSADKENEWVKRETINPVRAGQSLPMIPFQFHGPRSNETNVDRPPLDDVVNLNLSHYRTSADLEHGRHFCGLPTPWCFGVDESTQSLSIGSTEAWTSTNPETKAGMLEFTGQGLGALEKAQEQKEHQMAVLGAKMLEQQKRATETENAMQMKQSGEQSALGTIANTVGEGLEQCLKYAFWWSGTADLKLEDIGDKVSCEMNTDFVALAMPPERITALMTAWLQRGISKETLVWNLKQGEVIQPDVSVADELARIDAEPAPVLAAPPPTAAAP